MEKKKRKCWQFWRSGVQCTQGAGRKKSVTERLWVLKVVFLKHKNQWGSVGCFVGLWAGEQAVWLNRCGPLCGASHWPNTFFPFLRFAPPMLPLSKSLKAATACARACVLPTNDGKLWQDMEDWAVKLAHTVNVCKTNNAKGHFLMFVENGRPEKGDTNNFSRGYYSCINAWYYQAKLPSVSIQGFMYYLSATQVHEWQSAHLLLFIYIYIYINYKHNMMWFPFPTHCFYDFCNLVDKNNSSCWSPRRVSVILFFFLSHNDVKPVCLVSRWRTKQ